MSTLMMHAPEGATTDETIRSQVYGLLGIRPHHGPGNERRTDCRYPYPKLVHLTPVGVDGCTPEGEPVVATGKHLSERGLGFFHQGPLPYRRMIVSLETDEGGWVGFLIDLTWCRFTKHGWYESGGRLMQVVDSPLSALRPSPAPRMACGTAV
ncbi:MAG: hypothetical protein IIA67_03190 [Planctomycetes bacterium]|nr:hypothetical protein [Planctomycetota bacterium]